MSPENPFQDTEKLDVFINQNITSRLPEAEREGSRETVLEILSNYEGQDLNALSVLSLSATVGRYDEFVDKLNEFHNTTLTHVHPDEREGGHPKIESFFLQCYDSLDTKLAKKQD